MMPLHENEALTGEVRKLGRTQTRATNMGVIDERRNLRQSQLSPTTLWTSVNTPSVSQQMKMNIYIIATVMDVGYPSINA